MVESVLVHDEVAFAVRGGAKWGYFERKGKRLLSRWERRPPRGADRSETEDTNVGIEIFGYGG